MNKPLLGNYHKIPAKYPDYYSVNDLLRATFVLSDWRVFTYTAIVAQYTHTHVTYLGLHLYCPTEESSHIQLKSQTNTRDLLRATFVLSNCGVFTYTAQVTNKHVTYLGLHLYCPTVASSHIQLKSQTNTRDLLWATFVLSNCGVFTYMYTAQVTNKHPWLT